jgi:hypothetical protein
MNCWRKAQSVDMELLKKRKHEIFAQELAKGAPLMSAFPTPAQAAFRPCGNPCSELTRKTPYRPALKVARATRHRPA